MAASRTEHQHGSQPGRSLLEEILCPRCSGVLLGEGIPVACPGCGTRFPRLGRIPVVLSDAESYLRSCRQRLEEIENEVKTTVRRIREELEGPDILPHTHARGRAMSKGVWQQFTDVRNLLKPLLGRNPGDRLEPATMIDVPVTLEYLPYLYRDWGWPPDPDGGENENILGLFEEVLGGRELGRTLILGAGACRLPYDIHMKHPAAELVMLDIDPILFGCASAVTHGESLVMHEANLEICSISEASREWRLEAHSGPVDENRFHLVISDALTPPFPDEVLDTVITPWFIDQGPPDVRDLIGTLHRLLRPGGKWINVGPLTYEPTVPLPLRFSQDEVFDLARRVGFEIQEHVTTSAPYLVSKLNGRGKVEWITAFTALKVQKPAEAEYSPGPPPWLLFSHLPVPGFPGQKSISLNQPLFRLVVSAIDGKRSIDDLAGIIAENVDAPGFAPHEFRQAVRQCLGQVHPGCRTTRG